MIFCYCLGHYFLFHNYILKEIFGVLGENLVELLFSNQCNVLTQTHYCKRIITFTQTPKMSVLKSSIPSVVTINQCFVQKSGKSIKDENVNYMMTKDHTTKWCTQLIKISALSSCKVSYVLTILL